jgi:hypothetical protein
MIGVDEGRFPLDFQGIGLDVESNPIGNIIEVEGSEIYFQ